MARTPDQYDDTASKAQFMQLQNARVNDKPCHLESTWVWLCRVDHFGSVGQTFTSTTRVKQDKGRYGPPDTVVTPEAW